MANDGTSLDRVERAFWARYGLGIISSAFGAILFLGGLVGKAYLDRIDDKANHALITAEAASANSNASQKGVEFLNQRIDFVTKSLTEQIVTGVADRYTGADAKAEKERVNLAIKNLDARQTRTEQAIDRLLERNR